MKDQKICMKIPKIYMLKTVNLVLIDSNALLTKISIENIMY